jgi:hypothetical protein
MRGTLQRIDIELLHFHHSLIGALRLFRVGIRNDFLQCLRNDLPRDAEFVLHPSALLFSWVASFLEPVPIVVDFSLVITVDLEGYSGAEFVLRSAVQGRERLAIQFEGDYHDGAGLLAVSLFSCIGVVLDVGDLSVFEDGRVEISCFFGLAVEPETWCDLRRHCVLVSSCYRGAELSERNKNNRKKLVKIYTKSQCIIVKSESSYTKSYDSQ